MISPASMKNGIEISGKELTACIIRCGSMLYSMPLAATAPSATTPSAKAIGMPIAASTKNPMTMPRLIGLPSPKRLGFALGAARRAHSILPALSGWPLKRNGTRCRALWNAPQHTGTRKSADETSIVGRFSSHCSTTSTAAW